MENNISISTISKCRFGVSAIILESLYETDEIIDWVLLSKILRDVETITKSESEFDFISYIITKLFKVNSKYITRRSDIFSKEEIDRVEKLNYNFSKKEEEYIFEIYKRFIDEVILNILDNSNNIYNIEIQISNSELEKIYEIGYSYAIMMLNYGLNLFFVYNLFPRINIVVSNINEKCSVILFS